MCLPAIAWPSLALLIEHRVGDHINTSVHGNLKQQVTSAPTEGVTMIGR
jgi:hypothetical protein